MLCRDAVRYPSPSRAAHAPNAPAFSQNDTARMIRRPANDGSNAIHWQPSPSGLENVMQPPATIILLNGISSAGKTSIANVLQQTMETPYLQVSIDTFENMLP